MYYASFAVTESQAGFIVAGHGKWVFIQWQYSVCRIAVSCMSWSVYTVCSDRVIHQSSMDKATASSTETNENTSSEKQKQSAEKKTASAPDDTSATKR